MRTPGNLDTAFIMQPRLVRKPQDASHRTAVWINAPKANGGKPSLKSKSHASTSLTVPRTVAGNAGKAALTMGVGSSRIRTHVDEESDLRRRLRIHGRQFR